MSYIVYQHKNKINSKVYIGITCQIPKRRWGENGCNYKSSPHFYSAIQKYGWNNFEHNILYAGLTREEACEKEQELIKQYNSTNPLYGYNCTTGGESFALNDLAKEKISKAMIGNKNGLGHPCSEEKKKKISEAQKGRVFSEKQKAKLSEAAKNRPRTPCSITTKESIRAASHKRPVYCEELDKIFESVQECSRELGIPATNITKLCKGRGKTLNSYHLKYYNDIINA